MKPIKVLEDSNEYLVSVADYIYRLSTQYSIDKKDRDSLEYYADELMNIKKNLESMKDKWVYKQKMEKEEIKEK